MKTKVLILHTSVGFGIKATAENIAEQLNHDENFEVRVEDIEKVESGLMTSVTRTVYLKVLDKISPLWGFLYTSELVLSMTLPVRKFFASFKSKHILQMLREYQPAIVVSTQTVPSGVVAYLKSKGLYRGKLVIVFSDYHLHRFWLYDEADLYICNIPEQATQLEQLGVAEEKIRLTGTIIAEKYFKQISREDACLNLGLLTSMPVVLMGGAGRERAAMKEVFLQLLRSPKSFQVVAVCGNNPELKEELSQISAPARHPVKILGYADNVEVLMSAASVFVYKTGGPTMAQAVVKHLPMVLTDIRPGHEMINLEYLVAHGIAQYARIPREAVFMVEQILEGKVSVNHEKNYKQIVKPPGSVTVLEAVKALVPKPELPKIQDYQKSSR